MNLFTLLGGKNNMAIRSLLLQRNMMRSALQVTSRLHPELASRWATSLFLRPLRFKRSEQELLTLKSARSTYIIRKGRHRIATWTWGEGPKILLVHGWSGRGSQLLHFIEPLVAAGFSVVAFDAPAHGFSSGRYSSLVHFEKAIREIDNHIGPFYGAVCHSMGGSATLLAMKSGLRLERAVLVGSPAHLNRAADHFAQQFAVGEEVLKRMRSRIERLFSINWDDFSISAHYPPRTELLVIHDRGDREVPFHDAEQIAAWATNARLIATEGLGHRRILQMPNIVDAVGTFISAKKAG